MAITDKKTGPWGLDQVYNKINQGSIWSYSGAGQLWVWGSNNYGNFGVNNRTQYSSPVQVPGNWTNSKVFRKCGEADIFHSAVIKSDGTLWSWGNNTYGRLGHNNQTHYSSPVQVGSDTTWSSGDLLRMATGAIKTDNTLWSWGYGNWGMLGQNESNQPYSSPIQIPGTNWSQTAGGHLNCFGIKTDGTLYAWGNNHHGKLGLNQNQNDSGFSRSSPAQVPGTTWSIVSALPSGGGAVKTDGTLWMWGSNGSGNLGQGNLTQYSSPVQVPGTTWGKTTLTFPNGNNAMANIKTDGTLWMWGDNSEGQLGQNDRTSCSSPKQVPGTTWRSITTIGDSMVYIATKTDGTLWAWGKNDDGLVAQSTQPDNGGEDAYSSPTQIPGTAWTEMVGAAGWGGAVIKEV